MIGCKKKIRVKIKAVIASSASAKREVEKTCMIVHDKEKGRKEGIAEEKATLQGQREIRQKVLMERQQEKYRKAIRIDEC